MMITPCKKAMDGIKVSEQDDHKQWAIIVKFSDGRPDQNFTDTRPIGEDHSFWGTEQNVVDQLECIRYVYRNHNMQISDLYYKEI